MVLGSGGKRVGNDTTTLVEFIPIVGCSLFCVYHKFITSRGSFRAFSTLFSNVGRLTGRCGTCYVGVSPRVIIRGATCGRRLVRGNFGRLGPNYLSFRGIRPEFMCYFSCGNLDRSRLVLAFGPSCEGEVEGTPGGNIRIGVVNARTLSSFIHVVRRAKRESKFSAHPGRCFRGVLSYVNRSTELCVTCCRNGTVTNAVTVG